MLDKFKRDDDRGQVGIGTLIVFIAMVLVAAIAAGVLINTAGFLQSGAEETGQQSSDQVTNRLDVVSSTGESINGGDIERVLITVKKAPGANNIDLSSTTLQWIHSSGSDDLTYDSSSFDDGSGEPSAADPGSSNNFGVYVVNDDGSSLSSSSPVLDDPSDRAHIVIDTSSSSGLTTSSNTFGEGSTATVKMNTQSGGTTELRLVVPETLSGDSAVAL